MHRCLPIFVTVAGAAIAFTACGRNHHPARAPYLPLAEVQVTYGPLIAAGNHPTPAQNGTGERVGFFRDTSGTVWGFPLTAASHGEILACAPPLVHVGSVTDTFPADATIVGVANEPTGWRGGTGDLELLLRDARGAVRWQVVRGAQPSSGPVCWAPESPGPPQQLRYYRLAPIGGGTQ